MSAVPRPPVELGLPYLVGPIRFAVGSPTGLSSNSWRFWPTTRGDAYLKCRDNFNNVKVSFHASGRWRMAFTSEAVQADPVLVAAGTDRAWEVWDEPPELLPDVSPAFRLIFATSELAVEPHHRTTKQWRDTVFVEAAPEGVGKLTVVTLFITIGDPELQHGNEPSFRLASLALPDGRRAQLVAHAEPEGDVLHVLRDQRQAALRAAEETGVVVPRDGYLYFFGHHPDGARFVIGARATI